MRMLNTLMVLFALQGSDPPGSAEVGMGDELPFVYTTWRTFTTADGLPDDKIRVVRVWGDKVWVGTEGGLALFKEGVWESWTSKDGLPWPSISAIDVSPKTEDVWLGTWGGGLVRFTGGRFDRFDQLNSGLAGNLVFAVLVDGDRIWAATNGGISSFDTRSGTWSLHTARRADGVERVATGLVKEDDELYAGMWCDAVYRFDGDSGQWLPVASSTTRSAEASSTAGSSSDLTLQIALADAYLYRATPTGLLRLDPAGGWEARRLGDSHSAGDLSRCLAVRDAGKEVWLGTDAGLEVLTDWKTDSRVTYRRRPDSPGCVATVSRGGRVLESRMLDSATPGAGIRCLAFQGDNVWVGTVNGLSLGVGPGGFGGPGPASRPPAHAGEVHRNDGSPLPPAPTPPPSKGGYGFSATGFVAIAALGPSSRTIALPGVDYSNPPPSNRPDILALQLAVSELNARGGYRGDARFLLITGPEGYAHYGWGTPEDDFARYSRHPDVLGIVGRLHPHNRIASAVTLLCDVPVVSAPTSPPTVDEMINPWIFRCPGNEPRQYRMILDHLVDVLGLSRIAVLRTTDSLRGTPLDLVAGYLADQKPSRAKLVAQELYDRFSTGPAGDTGTQSVGQRSSLPSGSSPHPGELGRVLGAIQNAGADVVLTWNDAATSAAIVNGMRKIGMTQVFVGSERIVRAEFTELIGKNPGTVLAAYPNRADRDRDAARFQQRFTKRFKRPPSPDAYLSYLAGRHLLLAINIAGLDRAAVRRTLERMGRDTHPEHACLESSVPVETMLAHLKARRWTFEVLRRR